MKRFRPVLVLALLLSAAGLRAQTDPRETSYQFYVDGVLTAGIIGYQVNFNHSTVSRSDSRHLDTAYSPDVRNLQVAVTQKGLNRLQDWLNGATNTGTPVAKNVSLVVRTSDGTILVRWEFGNVTPTTVAASGNGTVGEVDATVTFLFDTMNQVQSKAD
ncbi:MAG TPA: hypothetical protein VMN82_10135 [Thermoanaerobaculia bacterium]|nr:hypothetical protein [Thermoanaerobaculia bacterium]